MRCSHCGFESPAGLKFCGECGSALHAAPPPAALEPPPSASAADLPEGERRQLTVMFCDLVGSTAISDHLDPEDLRRLLRDYQRESARVIRRLDGHIAKYLGDGLLVYFGYPRAHEDDALRAVRAARGVVEAMQALPPIVPGVRPEVRVGIHTGLVVVGDMGAGEQLEPMAIVGLTPNLAARLEQLAQPNTVLISAATHQLVKGFFAFRELGQQSLKGIAEPVTVFEVLHETTARSRLDVATHEGLTPLVGREKEVALILERWEQTREGLGQVVLISGDAGIGKSRLMRVLEDHVGRDPSAALARCACSPYHQNTAFFPIVELLEREFVRAPLGAPPEDKLELLEAFLTRQNLPLPESVPLLAPLLSLPSRERYAPLPLTPERQKQKTMELLLGILLQPAERQPQLLTVEDLHWADPSTVELLGHIIDRGPTVRLLTMMSTRPSFSPPWSMCSHLVHLALDRLAPRQSETMIRNLTGGRPLPAEVMSEIVLKTDGVPLFLEELVRMVLESGLLHRDGDRFQLRGPLPPLAVPATLQDSLMARLDRLSSVKTVAQLCAALGREFDYELLRAVSELDEATLQRGLRQLVEADVLYQRGIPPHAVYVFKHALIQEAAHASLLRGIRQRHHQRIAEVLEAEHPALAEAQPELLARHLTEARSTERAIAAWLRAGEQALRQSANAEAVAHLRRALELLDDLPNPAARPQLELTLLAALGPALIATRGFANPDVGEVYARARELCAAVGETTPRLFPVLWGLWVYYLVSGELRTSRSLAEEMLRLGETAADPELLLEAHWTLGSSLFWLGDLAEGRAHLEEAISLYHPDRDQSHAYRFGQDPGVGALCHLSLALSHLGFPDQALRRTDEALRLARQVGHPFSIGWALGFSALVRLWHRDAEGTLRKATETVEFCTEQAYPYWGTAGAIMRGWAVARLGSPEEGIRQMRSALDDWRAIGSGVLHAVALGLLAELLGEVGRTEEAIATLDEALELAARTGEAVSEIDLHRVRGLLLLPHDAAAGEAALERALRLAEQLGARSLALRAAVDLSALRERQGRRPEARRLLEAVLEPFIEGSATPDFNEARTRLRSLAEPGSAIR